MTGLDIARHRLHHQRIAQPAFNTPADVARWMGAMQAQDYHQAVWAVAARTPLRCKTSSAPSLPGRSSAPDPSAARSTLSRPKMRAGC